MALTLSEKAADEIKRMMADKGLPDGTLLRISVVGGGCSGFEYRMDFEQPAEGSDDLISESHGVRVAVDKKSAKYLGGTQIDYQESLMSRGFVFHNPLAIRTCGCGTSFQV